MRVSTVISSGVVMINMPGPASWWIRSPKPLGRMIFALSRAASFAASPSPVVLSVAQWEREAIAERTHDALQHKITKGERCGKVRFGYKLADDGKMLVPLPDEQNAIQLMKELRATGETLRDIAAELNHRGIQTKEGKPWQHTTINGILARAA